jgi:hypothetical protein
VVISNNKNSKLPLQSIDYRIQENDEDNPGKQVCAIYCRNFVEYKFRAIKNEFDEFLQIDCETCGNEWRLDSGLSVGDYFLLEHNPEERHLRSFKIQCLNCPAKFENLP